MSVHLLDRGGPAFGRGSPDLGATVCPPLVRERWAAIVASAARALEHCREDSVAIVFVRGDCSDIKAVVVRSFDELASLALDDGTRLVDLAGVSAMRASREPASRAVVVVWAEPKQMGVLGFTWAPASGTVAIWPR